MYYVMLCIVVCCSDLIDISAQAHSADVTEENEAQHRSKQYMYVIFIIYLSGSQACDHKYYNYNMFIFIHNYI